MAASPQDPHTAHSLWLQRRSIRRTNRRTQWRSDWTPFGLVFLLLGLLILLAVATDTVIMNRLRKLWTQHELQVTPEAEVPPGKQGDTGYAV